MHARPRPLLGAVSSAALALALALDPACKTTSGSSATPATTTPAPAPATAAATRAPPQKRHSVEGITEYQLANGMTVLLFPDTSRDRVTVNITYLVGSRHEGYGETGMAHLLEHMLFKGTKEHPDPWKSLQDHGAFFNGTTWLDRTNYYETMPASEDNLRWALRFEADRMVNSAIDPAVLRKEFSVVRNEFEMGENDPGGVLNERILSTAFLWHNYGKSTIGARSDIENVPAARLRKFYERYYQPDNAILVVAGDFDEPRALALIDEFYGPLSRPARSLESTYTIEPIQDGERAVTLRRTGDVGLVGVVYHSVAGADPDYVAAEALVSLMIDEPAGRLYKQLVETGQVASVDGFTFPFHDPGWLEFDAEVPGERPLEPIRDAMIETLESVADAGVTEEEIARYKHRTLKRFELAMANTTDVAIELSEWAALGDWRMMFLNRDRVEALTPARVQAFARDYLKRSNRTVGLFVPTPEPARAPMPGQPDVVALVDGYQGRGAVQAGEAFAATLDNIERRTTRAQIEPGIKLALVPKKTRGAAVTMRLRLHLGSLAELKGVAKNTAANMVAAMLTRGTREHSYQQLRDALDRLKANVHFDGAGTSVTVYVETVRDSVPDVIALIAEALRTPTFPRREFEVVRKEWLASTLEDRNDPQARAFNAMSRALAPYPKDHVDYVPTLDETLAAIQRLKQRDVKAVHRTLWGASHGEFAIVGDFDPELVSQAFAQHLGDWSNPRPYVRVPDTYHDVPGDRAPVTIDTPDKEMAMILMGQNLELRDDDPDYPALVLANFMLGGSSDSRLLDRLRQKEGWSYGAFSFVSASAFERSGRLVAGAICAPQNAERALRAMAEEIERFVVKGVTEDELAKAKRSFKAEFDNSLASDETIAGLHARQLERGRTLAFTADQHAAIAALTTAQIQQVVQRRIKMDRFRRFLAGDLTKAGLKQP